MNSQQNKIENKIEVKAKEKALICEFVSGGA
jgi:hypothetical protein